MLSVDKGSNNSPEVLILRYKGDNNNDKKYGIAGKGITFDAGGLNLKIHNYMRYMKIDMSGAATSVAVLLLAFANNLKINLVSICGFCENLLNEKSYRPGDIVKTRSGKTVEIGNTDAEGRMVLIDLIDFLQTVEKVETILTIATLTGSCSNFFHLYTTPFLTNNKEVFSSLVYKAAELSPNNEAVCALPFD